MAQPYIGEIRMFAGTFNPVGWEFCNGQLLPISENEALFQLIGTTYGGDGESTFALPNLQSRVPMHMGTGPDGVTYQLAEAAGVESVTLTIQQIPNHTHALLGSQDIADATSPANVVFGTSSQVDYVTVAEANTALSPQIITPAGGGQPHDNMQPYLVINFIISLFGIFPSQT